MTVELLGFVALVLAPAATLLGALGLAGLLVAALAEAEPSAGGSTLVRPRSGDPLP